MQHTVKIPPPSAFEPGANPVFSVVIAYEDLESGKQAKHAYDFLAEKIGSECHFTNQMWKFDVLGIPNLRDIAVKDAAMADIIIIACQSDDLPVQAKNWMESWLALPSNAMALIALLRDSQTTQSAATRVYLAEAAKRAKMEFFTQPQKPTSRNLTEDLPYFQRSALREIAPKPFTIALPRGTSGSRWGINE
jgi:hypothetical protein